MKGKEGLLQSRQQVFDGLEMGTKKEEAKESRNGEHGRQTPSAWHHCPRKFNLAWCFDFPC